MGPPACPASRWGEPAGAFPLDDYRPRSWARARGVGQGPSSEQAGPVSSLSIQLPLRRTTYYPIDRLFMGVGVMGVRDCQRTNNSDHEETGGGLASGLASRV
jgi:hypothetical protein